MVLRSSLIALVASVLCLASAGCIEAPVQDEAGPASLRDLNPDVPLEDLEVVIDDNRRLAFELYQAVRQQHRGNLFSAPYGASVTMAMCYAGARGETEAEMAHALRFGLPQERFHPARNALDLAIARSATTPPGDETLLDVGNGVWAQRGLAVLDEYQQTLALNYGAELELLDFRNDPASATRALDDWACQRTRGAICEFPVPVRESTRAVVANAIHFGALWKGKFPPSRTHKAEFQRLDGTDVEAWMMEVEIDADVAWLNGLRVLELPYAGDAFSMLIILPDLERFDQVESSLDAAFFLYALGSLERRPVAVVMPRFSINSTLPLEDALMQLGMPSAFDENRADFAGMTADANFVLQAVRQQAVVEVTEEGTEAAAVTGAAFGMVSDATTYVTLDSPFLFVVLERSTAAPVFIGRVVDPSAG